MTTYRLTAAGPVSRIPHITIFAEPSIGTTDTLVVCRRCGADLRQRYPGSMVEIDAWMRHHLHEQGSLLTIITVDEDGDDGPVLYARAIRADAASGDLVAPGRVTDAQIRALADERLSAPYQDQDGVSHGDWRDVPIIWTDEDA